MRQVSLLLVPLKRNAQRTVRYRESSLVWQERGETGRQNAALYTSVPLPIHHDGKPEGYLMS